MLKKMASICMAVVFVVLVGLPLQTPAASAVPNLAIASYTGLMNPYTAAGYKGECTWYAWGRAHEVLGVKLPAWSNAITWFNSALNSGYTVGSEPRANAIAVWGGSGGYGHVAFVEAVSSTHAYVTEGGWGGSGGGFAGEPKCHAENVPLARMQKGVERHPGSWYKDVLIGYIYLRGVDSEPPVISDVSVSEVSAAGYTVRCVVSDDTMVSRVQFGTFVTAKGRKSLPKDWQTNAAYAGTNVEGSGVYVFRVKDSDYGHARGEYQTMITAFDGDGNKKNSRMLRTKVENNGIPAASAKRRDNTYILVNDTVSYAQAQQACEAQGGYLATIGSAAEQAVVEALLLNQPRAQYFIGADRRGAASWGWGSGEKFGYKRWAKGQPAKNESERVGAMFPGGRWKAVSEKSKGTGFIVEIPKQKSGWEKEGAHCYYYALNKRKTGWLQAEGKTYFLSEDKNKNVQGRALTSWQEIKGKTYYFRSSGTVGVRGEMLTGWQKIKGKLYFFNNNGKLGYRGTLAAGWRKIGGRFFFLQADGTKGEKGQPYAGWKEISGKTYYFNETGKAGAYGAAEIGWGNIADKRYYFQPSGGPGKSGALVTGWQNIAGRWYYFAPRGEAGKAGVLYTGLRTIEGNRFYFQDGGNAPERGSMATGWTTYKGNTYYFDTQGKAGARGAALRGDQTIEGIRYRFDGAGVCLNPERNPEYVGAG